MDNGQWMMDNGQLAAAPCSFLSFCHFVTLSSQQGQPGQIDKIDMIDEIDNGRTHRSAPTIHLSLFTILP